MDVILTLVTAFSAVFVDSPQGKKMDMLNNKLNKLTLRMKKNEDGLESTEKMLSQLESVLSDAKTNNDSAKIFMRLTEEIRNNPEMKNLKVFGCGSTVGSDLLWIAHSFIMNTEYANRLFDAYTNAKKHYDETLAKKTALEVEHAELKEELDTLQREMDQQIHVLKTPKQIDFVRDQVLKYLNASKALVLESVELEELRNKTIQKYYCDHFTESTLYSGEPVTYKGRYCKPDCAYPCVNMECCSKSVSNRLTCFATDEIQEFQNKIRDANKKVFKLEEMTPFFKLVVETLKIKGCNEQIDATKKNIEKCQFWLLFT
jgi:hypothetical protein